WTVHQAYEFMNQGDLAVEAGDFELASNLYKNAEAMFPDNLEMQYWHAINLVNTGKLEEALPMFKNIFSKDKNWKDLTPRLIKNEVLVADDKTLKKIMKQ
ncbi:MAG: tetratricopeptide (TPR) repeat protein, partial [Cyclobacteriaceae bacterium]